MGYDRVCEHGKGYHFEGFRDSRKELSEMRHEEEIIQRDLLKAHKGVLAQEDQNNNHYRTADNHQSQNLTSSPMLKKSVSHAINKPNNQYIRSSEFKHILNNMFDTKIFNKSLAQKITILHNIEATQHAYFSLPKPTHFISNVRCRYTRKSLLILIKTWDNKILSQVLF